MREKLSKLARFERKTLAIGAPGRGPACSGRFPPPESSSSCHCQSPWLTGRQFPRVSSPGSRAVRTIRSVPGRRAVSTSVAPLPSPSESAPPAYLIADFLQPPTRPVRPASGQAPGSWPSASVQALALLDGFRGDGPAFSVRRRCVSGSGRAARCVWITFESCYRPVGRPFGPGPGPSVRPVLRDPAADPPHLRAEPALSEPNPGPRLRHWGLRALAVESVGNLHSFLTFCS
jgi:hypothetical protein